MRDLVLYNVAKLASYGHGPRPGGPHGPGPRHNTMYIIEASNLKIEPTIKKLVRA